MSLGVLLSKENHVTIYDINADRVNLVNQKQSTIADVQIDSYLADHDLNLRATNNAKMAYTGADYVIVATPTNYDPAENSFDTSAVDSVVNEALDTNATCLVVIKSTIPVGHTRKLQENTNTNRVIFSPEFLREGRALHDNLYPSRIIVGGCCNLAHEFGGLLKDAAIESDVPLLFMNSTEAEAVKLFANTYLAMRVAYFNELDTYSLEKELDTESIIRGVGLDLRIGEGYSNPSFGYGGYCLPKDTKQLKAEFSGIPQDLISAIVRSNVTRQEYLAQKVLETRPGVVGLFRLLMKSGSDNFRDSAMQGILTYLVRANVEILLYEPDLNADVFNGATVVRDLAEFKARSDIVLTNREAAELEDVRHKCFTRDVFGDN